MTVEEFLDRLEDDIRRLKVEFDIYFNGGTKRPPYETKGRVESIIKRLYDDRSMTFAQRYRYNSLVARFTSFRELWRRNIQALEEGQNINAGLAGTFSERPSSAGAAGYISPPPQPARFAPITVNCADPQREIDKVIALYNSVLDAKKQCGESTDKLSFEQFHKIIITQSTKLKAQLQCGSINFSVEVEQGQVKFKAKGGK
ncbi:MAG: MXAN_5187 C-terminal domain-containing protein [Acidobacteriota bacterium]